MNADIANVDRDKPGQFLQFWMEVTEAPHVTLVSIIPDGQTTTYTFERGDLSAAKSWIAERQRGGRNIYFQPNETHPGCNKKPSKQDMPAALCRFADIDPVDDQCPLADERGRLARLAEHLADDPVLAPTAIIDSGNGIQPIWAVSREPLSPSAITRIESETKALENALGAGGTHNIDRLLRLPGTINFPNSKKRALGRGLSRARLSHCGANIYTTAQGSKLSEHLAASLAGTGLVRPKPQKAGKGPTAEGEDHDLAALMNELRAAGADGISRDDHLPAELYERLHRALNARKRLEHRWAGRVDDLSEAGCDSSRSGADMSLAGMLKVAGFSRLDAGLILCAFEHGKANNDQWANGALRLRAVARCIIRSHNAVPADLDPVTALIAEFNEQYMVVNEAGKAIIHEPAHDAMLNRRYYRRITFEDLKRLYLNRRICVGEDNRGNAMFRPVADVWLSHPDRRQFIGGVIFDPSQRHVGPSVLNLWQGFAVQPRAGSWARLQDHIQQVICAGNREYFVFLMGWMARLVQVPAEQGEVAAVMRGGEGTGKGTLARALLRVFGQHGLAISNSKHLTGNFNGHLRDTVLLFADEAFFAGDRAHVGVLKALITEPMLTIKSKYQNAVQTPNYIHLMMASNEDWVVPASLDARRFFVLEVSAEKANDHAYFAAIFEELDAGGYEAMLHDLQHYDLTSFNPRRVPATAGLQTQRKLSLPTAEDWWAETFTGVTCSSRGSAWMSTSATGTNRWPRKFCSMPTRHTRRRGASATQSGRESLGKFMVRMGAKPSRPRNTVIGERIADVPNAYGGTTRKAELIRVDRTHGFSLGSLAAARAGFETATGLEMEWPAADGDAS